MAITNRTDQSAERERLDGRASLDIVKKKLIAE